MCVYVCAYIYIYIYITFPHVYTSPLSVTAAVWNDPQETFAAQPLLPPANICRYLQYKMSNYLTVQNYMHAYTYTRTEFYANIYTYACMLKDMYTHTYTYIYMLNDMMLNGGGRQIHRSAA